MTREISDNTFAAVLAEGKPVVIDCWAPWCGPCRMMSPIVDELAQEYADKVIVGKLNVDDNSEICEQFGIMSIPTILFFRNGKLVDTQVGASRKNDLQARIDALL
jgi:thioredoxin 1